MPDNKRQHYVPKYTLRYFSSDPKQKRINLINIKRAKIIHGASLRDQCYRDYFYSAKTEVEKSISTLEGAFATLTDRIVNTEQLEDLNAGTITLMISLQRARTLRASEELNTMMSKMMKLAAYGRIDEEQLRKIEIGFKNSSNLSVATSIALSPMILDLDQFLLVNRTSVPFIISDNPVVLTNWFGRSRFPMRGICGIARPGLQLAMPLSTKYSLLLHDRYIYKNKGLGHTIVIHRTDEIEALNALQWINAYQNVYFPTELSATSINKLMTTVRCSDEMVELTRFDYTGADGVYERTEKDEYSGPSNGVRREFVQLGTRELPYDIRLNQIGVRSQPRYHDDGSAASPLRDPAWCKIVEDFADAVQKHQITFSYLGVFAERHPLFGKIKPALRRILAT